MFAIDAEALSPAALRRRWHELAEVMPEDGRAELEKSSSSTSTGASAITTLKASARRAPSASR